jgi:hypothetical protein
LQCGFAVWVPTMHASTSRTFERLQCEQKDSFPSAMHMSGPGCKTNKKNAI